MTTGKTQTARLARLRNAAPSLGRGWPDTHLSRVLRAGILVALVSGIFAGVVTAEFIWDDEANVIHNATLRSLDGLRQMWFVRAQLNSTIR